MLLCLFRSKPNFRTDALMSASSPASRSCLKPSCRYSIQETYRIRDVVFRRPESGQSRSSLNEPDLADGPSMIALVTQLEVNLCHALVTLHFHRVLRIAELREPCQGALKRQGSTGVHESTVLIGVSLCNAMLAPFSHRCCAVKNVLKRLAVFCLHSPWYYAGGDGSFQQPQKRR